MKEEMLSILRDRSIGTAEFRKASIKLARVLSGETIDLLDKYGIPRDEVLVVPILRAGLALFPAFADALPGAPVGVLGLERDEKTAEARTYYKKFPESLPKHAIIIDPMLATGGSAEMAVNKLINEGLEKENIYFTGVIAAQEGFDRLSKLISEENIIVSAIDQELDAQKFIVPGLGDFGDRYFGTE